MLRGQVARAVAAVALLGLSVGCGSGGGAEQPKGTGGGISVVAVTSTGEPTARPTPTPEPTPTPTPVQVCEANPDPASPKVLQVEEPLPNQQVKMPIRVRGWWTNIGLRNQGVALAIVDAKQTVLQVLDPVPPQPRTFRVAPPGLEITNDTRPFAADVVLADVTQPTPICLWVYQETTPEGQPKGVVQVQVIVLP